MFDGMPEHFLAPTTSLSPSFSLHHANFQQQQQQQQQCFDAMMPTCLLQQVGSSEPSSLMVPHCVVVDNVPWSNEEVLSLLKIISSLDSPWFPSPFTWDNVSRKLAEVGFKRSAQKCKEKFEEETRSFNNNRHKSNVISQNYRLFGELEDLYNNNNNSNNNNNDNDDANNVNDGNYANDHLDDDSREQQSRHLDNTFDDYPSDQMMNNNDDNNDNDNDNSDVGDEEGGQGVVGGGEEREEEAKRIVRKRKREKFEMFKGFCENIVNKVIAKQEEMHCKVLEDMLKREEQKIAREEAWKKQEIDRITQVMQVRAHEQAIVGDRQAKILGFLKKFSSLSSNNNGETNQSLGETLGSVVLKVQNTSTYSLLSTSSSMLSQDTISETTTTTHDQVSNLVSQSSPNRLENNPQLALPISSSSLNQPFKNQVEPVSFDHTSTDATGQTVSFESSRNHNESKVVVADVKDDTGRRWPRDEVLALINIRCNLFDNNNGDHRDRESFSKGPLWERISQKMMELGYKRSAKRCKEKWENINKYFRKTKDSSKKRSIDSRTCPYFHQLSHLYNQQGALHDQFECPTNPAGLSGNKLVPSDGATAINTVPSQQNKGIVEQLPTCQMSYTLNFDYTIT